MFPSPVAITALACNGGNMKPARRIQLHVDALYSGNNSIGPEEDISCIDKPDSPF